MKVLHLLSSSRFSGAENVACQIISLFHNSGIEMAYCSPDGNVRAVLEEKEIPFVGLPSFSLTAIRNAIDTFSPDIIHAHDVKASIYAGLLFNHKRVISHMHVNNSDMNKWGIKPIIYLYSSKWYEHIFWVSNSAFTNYIFHNKVQAKSSILYNIIDRGRTLMRASKDKNNYNYDIIYVGRITYQKNPERLLKIIKGVVSRRPETTIAIVGSGDLLENMMREAANLGLQNNIIFSGYSNNPLKMIFQSKMLLMASRFEGTPMTALESMCLGTPIVSTPTDGMNEIIQQGVNGFLSDNDESLIQYCLKIVSDPDMREEMGKNALKIFKDLCDPEAYKNILNKYYIANGE